MNRWFLLTMLVVSGSDTLVKSQTLSGHHYMRVEIHKDFNVRITTDSVYIDTLIMHDQSELLFSLNTLLLVDHAIIGNNCTWNGGGRYDVENRHGQSITAVVVFKKLGSLLITTQGANGDMGMNGMVGASAPDGSNTGTNGGQGGNGGDGTAGGNAGDIRLFYDCEGFLPLFNSKGLHTITFNTTRGIGGAGGKGGQGGKGSQPIRGTDYTRDAKGIPFVIGSNGQNGLRGVDGIKGRDGKDGLLIFKRID